MSLNMNLEMRKLNGSQRLYPEIPDVNVDGQLKNFKSNSNHSSKIDISSLRGGDTEDEYDLDENTKMLEVKEYLKNEYRCLKCIKKFRRCKNCADRRKRCRNGRGMKRFAKSLEKLNQLGLAISDNFKNVNVGVVKALKLISIIMMICGLFIGGTNLYDSIISKNKINSEVVKVNSSGLAGTGEKISLIIKKIDEYVSNGHVIVKRDVEDPGTEYLSRRRVEKFHVVNDHYTKCVYWMADCKGMVVPRVVANRGLNFSLHGAWGDETFDHGKVGIFDDCLTIDEFKKVFIPLVHFIDNISNVSNPDLSKFLKFLQQVQHTTEYND